MYSFCFLRIVSRLSSAICPHTSHFEPTVHPLCSTLISCLLLLLLSFSTSHLPSVCAVTESKEREIHPLGNYMEPKRRFIPSKWEEAKIVSDSVHTERDHTTMCCWTRTRHTQDTLEIHTRHSQDTLKTHTTHTRHTQNTHTKHTQDIQDTHKAQTARELALTPDVPAYAHAYMHTLTHLSIQTFSYSCSMRPRNHTPTFTPFVASHTQFVLSFLHLSPSLLSLLSSLSSSLFFCLFVLLLPLASPSLPLFHSFLLSFLSFFSCLFPLFSLFSLFALLLSLSPLSGQDGHRHS